MKKSEMIKLMDELLVKRLMGTRNPHDRVVNMGIFIDTAVELGMLPPRIIIPGKWQSYGDDRYWEPEDEI